MGRSVGLAPAFLSHRSLGCMSRRKSNLPSPVSYVKRPYAVRSVPLFPLPPPIPPSTDATTAASSSSFPSSAAVSRSPSLSPAVVDRASVVSHLSIRPFDMSESEDESEVGQSVSAAAANGGKADIWSVQPSSEVQRTTSDPGYSVSGYAVTGWAYVTKPPTRPAQPLTADERRMWKEVAVEDAMRELELSYGHRMRVKLKRRTASQLQTAMRREAGEIDRTVLRLCESGQLTSKVGLYRVIDHNHTASDKQFTLVTKQPMKQYEPICAVIGTLREHHAYRKLSTTHTNSHSNTLTPQPLLSRGRRSAAHNVASVTTDL